MTCPVCGEPTVVLDSRRDEESVYRKRKCIECGYIIYTYEVECETNDDFKRVRKQYLEHKRKNTE